MNLELAGTATRKPTAMAADRLIFKTDGRYVFVKATEIRWIGAEGNYLRVYLAGATHLIRETMRSVEQRLDEKVFLRIHRSTIINLHYLKELRSSSAGDGGSVVLDDGTRLPLSRSYRARVAQLVQGASIG